MSTHHDPVGLLAALTSHLDRWAGDPAGLAGHLAGHRRYVTGQTATDPDALASMHRIAHAGQLAAAREALHADRRADFGDDDSPVSRHCDYCAVSGSHVTVQRCPACGLPVTFGDGGKITGPDGTDLCEFTPDRFHDYPVAVS